MNLIIILMSAGVALATKALFNAVKRENKK